MSEVGQRCRVNRADRAGFFWQGALVILPVAILAVVGLASLRQDRLLASQEAKERAEILAGDLASRLWERLSRDPGPDWNRVAEAPGDGAVLRLELDAAGGLVDPPSCPITPTPAPLDLTALTAEQLRLWTAARTAAYLEPSGPGAIDLWEEVLRTEPPQRFLAAAQFARGVALAQAGRQSEADDAFGQVAERYGDLPSESGVPLRTLADLQRLRAVIPGAASARDNSAPPTASNSPPSGPMDLTRAASNPGSASDLEAICVHALQHPSLMTPRLLELAAARLAHAGVSRAGRPLDWLAAWDRHELARRMYRAATLAGRAPQATPSAFWSDLDESWLTIAQARGGAVSNEAVWIARPESAVRQAVASVVSGAIGKPETFGADVEFAGRTLWAGTSAAPPSPSEPKLDPLSPRPARGILAQRTQEWADGAQWSVKVFLADPDRFYARQRSRTRWFGGLIAVSACTALAGLFLARQSFHRQRRLGEMKSNFVSSVSHELRAPIASVRLLTERLSLGRVPTEEKRQEYFRLMLRECQRLTALIENVLDIARIERNRKTYEKEPLDALELARQTVETMAPAASERRVRLVLEPPPPGDWPFDLLPCWDGRAVQQALVNLIDNAVKHSTAGQTVTVGLAARSEKSGPTLRVPSAAASSRILLWVEDRGSGIPPSEQERIFERFFRLGSELRRDTPGAGIGLSIVKHVAEAHGGRIVVRSAPGQGSRFTLELPIS